VTVELLEQKLPVEILAMAVRCVYFEKFVKETIQL
jgi:hypothetical protein